MLRWLAGGADAVGPLSVTDWFALCEDLDAHGMLPTSTSELSAAAPSPVMRKVAALQEQTKARAALRLQALDAFADEADHEHLTFLVIKGMAASKRLHGDEFARKSGDIDILVAPDDIPKADYAARKAGWIEPGEAFPVRRALDSGRSLDASEIKKLAGPYPLRSNSALPNVTDYYYAHEGGQIDTLEIHDRFHCLSGEAASSLMASAQVVKLGDREYLTCSDAAGLVVSLLALYDDAESVRSNADGRGELGFKTCDDIRRWLCLLDEESQLETARQLIEGLGVQRETGIALHDCCEIFPCAAPLARRVAPLRKSPWEMEYAQRSLNVPARTRNAREVISRAICAAASSGDGPLAPFEAEKASEAADSPAQTRWITLQALGAPIATFFQMQAIAGPASISVTWRLPSFATREGHERLLRCALIMIGASDVVSLAYLDILFESGTWKAIATPIERRIDVHVGRMIDGSSKRMAAVEHDGDALVVAASVPYALLGFNEERPRKAFAMPSAHEHIYGRLSRRCAGHDLQQVVELLLRRNR